MTLLFIYGCNVLKNLMCSKFKSLCYVFMLRSLISILDMHVNSYLTCNEYNMQIRHVSF